VTFSLRFFHLSVEFVDQMINRCVHIIFCAIGKNIVPAHVHCGFCFVSSTLYFEDDVNVTDFIEVALKSAIFSLT